jgi:hypothetical protein
LIFMITDLCSAISFGLELSTPYDLRSGDPSVRYHHDLGD